MMYNGTRYVVDKKTNIYVSFQPKSQARLRTQIVKSVADASKRKEKLKVQVVPLESL